MNESNRSKWKNTKDRTPSCDNATSICNNTVIHFDQAPEKPKSVTSAINKNARHWTSTSKTSPIRITEAVCIETIK